MAQVEGQIDQRRGRHAARRRQYGGQGLSGGGQFSGQHFAFDFQTHQKEKDGHQAVVHPEDQRLAQFVAFRPHGERVLPEGMPGWCQGRIGRAQRKYGAGKQQDAAGCLYAHEGQKGVEQAIGRGRRTCVRRSQVVTGVVRHVDSS